MIHQIFHIFPFLVFAFFLSSWFNERFYYYPFHANDLN